MSGAAANRAGDRIAAPLRWQKFLGPGLLVSVGYMDPGNWATDLAGGSQYGYRLLWVVLLSSLMAMALQTLCVRLGLVTGLDLALACREYFPKWLSIFLWALCEIAIIACDLAEVIGSAVALQLLFGIPIVWGVVITAFDVLLLLALGKFGMRKIEAIVLVFVATVTACFALESFLAKPDHASIIHGLLVPSVPDRHAILIIVGILGATVMPHNLYLHSNLVREHRESLGSGQLPQAVKFATLDVIISLSLAFFVNAGILILAAAVFQPRGLIVEELGQAHELIKPLLGGAAATAFAIGLLASGQSSTITGTLAGQVVMEGFLNWKIDPWKRRLVSRLIAIIPALILVIIRGGKGTIDLLVVSQVVLSLQLPFAVVPLVMFTGNRRRMGAFATPRLVQAGCWVLASVIIVLNLYLLVITFK